MARLFIFASFMSLFASPLSPSWSLTTLALSYCKVVDDAVPFIPNRPKMCTMAEDAAAGSLLGSIFLPPRCRVLKKYICHAALTFFVVCGKMAVRMRLNGCSGKTARFTVSKGGLREAPCNTQFGMANPLLLQAQLLFWRLKMAAAAVGTGAAVG
jgi:hypothetical protein